MIARCGKWRSEVWLNGLGWDVWHTCHTHYEAWNDGRITLTRRADNLCGYEGYMYCQTRPISTAQDAIHVVECAVHECPWELCDGIEV